MAWRWSLFSSVENPNGLQQQLFEASGVSLYVAEVFARGERGNQKTDELGARHPR